VLQYQTDKIIETENEDSIVFNQVCSNFNLKFCGFAEKSFDRQSNGVKRANKGDENPEKLRRVRAQPTCNRCRMTSRPRRHGVVGV